MGDIDYRPRYRPQYTEFLHWWMRRYPIISGVFSSDIVEIDFYRRVYEELCRHGLSTEGSLAPIKQHDFLESHLLFYIYTLEERYYLIFVHYMPNRLYPIQYGIQVAVMLSFSRVPRLIYTLRKFRNPISSGHFYDEERGLCWVHNFAILQFAEPTICRPEHQPPFDTPYHVYDPHLLDTYRIRSSRLPFAEYYLNVEPYIHQHIILRLAQGKFSLRLNNTFLFAVNRKGWITHEQIM